MRALLLLSLGLLVIPPLRAAEVAWWREFPEDRLEKTARGMEWFPVAPDREVHAHFDEIPLGLAKGSRVSVSGEITFRGQTLGRDHLDSLRIGLFHSAKPTRRDGPREVAPAEGFEFKLNPQTKPDKKGVVVKPRRRTDPANQHFVLHAMTWKAPETPHPGFGCRPGQAYPFVLDVERVDANEVIARLLLNDRAVEQRIPDLTFDPNTFAIGRTGSGTWTSVKVEGLSVKAVTGRAP